jgi:quercetin dioxygenase-like cupin family protein
MTVLLDKVNFNGSELDVAEMTMAAGLDSGEHAHQAIEIFYVLSGELEHSVNGKSELLKPGMVGFVRPPDKVRHRVPGPVPVKTLVIWSPGGEAGGSVGAGSRNNPDADRLAGTSLGVVSRGTKKRKDGILPAMKKLSFAAVLVLLIAASAWAQDAKPSFTGKWSVDMAKSDFGPMPPPESVVIEVRARRAEHQVEDHAEGPQGETTNERSVTTDGRKHQQAAHGDGRPGREVNDQMGQQEAGDRLQARLSGMSIDVSESWELSDDGKA